MKLPETGEASSTIATRDGGWGGVFWWSLRLNTRTQDEGHVSDRLSMVGTSTILIPLVQQLPSIAPRKLVIT